MDAADLPQSPFQEIEHASRKQEPAGYAGRHRRGRAMGAGVPGAGAAPRIPAAGTVRGPLPGVWSDRGHAGRAVVAAPAAHTELARMARTDLAQPDRQYRVLRAAGQRRADGGRGHDVDGDRHAAAGRHARGQPRPACRAVAAPASLAAAQHCRFAVHQLAVAGQSPSCIAAGFAVRAGGAAIVDGVRGRQQPLAGAVAFGLGARVEFTDGRGHGWCRGTAGHPRCTCRNRRAWRHGLAAVCRCRHGCRAAVFRRRQWLVEPCQPRLAADPDGPDDCL